MALTVRVKTDEEKKLIEDIKAATNKGSAAAALMDAAKIVLNDLPKLKENIRELELELDEIKDSNANVFELVKRQKELSKELANLDNEIDNAITTKSGSDSADTY